MIRKILIPKKEIQVIDLRNICKRKKQLEAIDVSLCPKSTAIVQDQDGNELARQQIASGDKGIITIQAVQAACEAAVARLLNSNGDLLSTNTIDSGQNQNLVAPDAGIRIEKSNGGLIARVLGASGTGVPPDFLPGTEFQVPDSRITLFNSIGDQLEQVFILADTLGNSIDAPDAIANLVNTNGDPISSNSIPSNVTEEITAPDATAVVKDQDGNELARQDIASGATGIIPVNVGGSGTEVLYTYPYDSLNTGQNVSYATGDDKWVRDNVFNPEIASWDTSLVWSFPVLNQNDPTKLLRGSNPDGSGTNIFGNLERFTDTLGGQDYVNGLVVDHYTGLMITKDAILNFGNWITFLNFHNDRNFGSYQDWHGGNNKEFISLIDFSIRDVLGFPPFNYTSSSSGGADPNNLWSSTTVATPVNDNAYQHLIDFGASYGLVTRGKSINRTFGFSFRKAFTYNPTTKQMDLI